MGTVAAQLAEAVATQYRAGLPPRIRGKGKDLLLNAAAVAIAGRDDPGLRVLKSGWPPPPGPGTGAGRRRDPGAGQVALLFAAASAQGTDGDDRALIHPGGVNMAAALGAASLTDVTGRDFLTAFLLGCETELRFARSLTPGAREQGWDLDGICGTLSAAITAALVLGAGPETLATSVGIAASSTLGHRSSTGTALRPFILGKAAANGVTAALLSRQGFTASSGALDSPRGLGAALVRRPAVFSTVASGFGTEWLLDEVLAQRHDDVAEPLVIILSAIDEQPDVRSLMTAACG